MVPIFNEDVSINRKEYKTYLKIFCEEAFYQEMTNIFPTLVDDFKEEFLLLCMIMVESILIKSLKEEGAKETLEDL